MKVSSFRKLKQNLFTEHVLIVWMDCPTQLSAGARVDVISGSCVENENKKKKDVIKKSPSDLC